MSLAGQKPVALDFTSTYPISEPNGLLAHLSGQGSLGFDSAAYLGFAFGATQLDLRAQDGLVTIGPIATTVNKGKLNFTGKANFRQPPGVLATQKLVPMAQGIQINEQTAKALLKYVNPIFADAVSVSGTANFDVQQMAIPLMPRPGTRPSSTPRSPSISSNSAPPAFSTRFSVSSANRSAARC